MLTREDALKICSLVTPMAAGRETGMGRVANDSLASSLRMRWPEYNWRVYLDRGGQFSCWAVTIDSEGRADGECRPMGSASLRGYRFTLTGTLPKMSRSEAEEFITARGGRVDPTVSKNTDYLVAGGKPGTKVRKAHEFGVKVIDETELERLGKEEY